MRSWRLAGACVLVVATPLCAQRSEVARVGVSHLARAEATTPRPPVAVDPEPGPLRWPYIGGGALIGGAVAGVVVAQSYHATDDAPIGPIGSTGAVVVGAMVAGAILGWLVSELVR